MRLKNVDVGEGSLSPEQITEFIDQMQVYEGAMYEISTKLEILDSEFQVRFSHNPIHHMERRLKSLNSILGKLQRRNLPLTVDAIKDNLKNITVGVAAAGVAGEAAAEEPAQEEGGVPDDFGFGTSGANSDGFGF